MFNKNTAPKPTEDNPAQNTVVRMPDRGPEFEHPRRPIPAPANTTPANDAAKSSATKKSLISEGFDFAGDIKSEGALTVDGTIKGNMIVQSLAIGTTGAVDGSVTADSISVEGCLSGIIECEDLIVGSRAVVDGQLSYNTITIQKGGTIKGDLKRK